MLKIRTKRSQWVNAYWLGLLVVTSLSACTKERPRGVVPGAVNPAPVETVSSPENQLPESPARENTGGEESPVSPPAPSPSLVPTPTPVSHAYLIQVGPGRCFDEAFGHVMIALEVPLERGGETSAVLKVYSAGMVGFQSALTQAGGNPGEAARLFFGNQVKAPTVSQVTTWSQLREGKIPRSVVANYHGRPTYCQNLKRSIDVFEMSLNQAQIEALKLSLDQRVQRDRDPQLQSTYHPYDRNCTTEMRDHLLSDGVIRDSVREGLKNDNRSMSLHDIVNQNLDRSLFALQAFKDQNQDEQPLIQFSDNPLVGFALRGMLGLTETGFSSGSELQTLVDGLRSAQNPRSQSPLNQMAVQFFTRGDTLDDMPSTRFDQIFLPFELTLMLQNARVSLTQVGHLDAELAPVLTP